MTPELANQINAIASLEAKMNLIELDHMAIDHSEGYQGEKRKHRYNSRWRNESVICLINFVVDHYRYRPVITLTYASIPAPETYEAGIQAIVNDYEVLRTHYALLSDLAANAKLYELLQYAQTKIKYVAETKMRYMRDLDETRGLSADYRQIRSDAAHEKYKAKESEFRIG